MWADEESAMSIDSWLAMMRGRRGGYFGRYTADDLGNMHAPWRQGKWSVVDHNGNPHRVGSRADCLEAKRAYALNLGEYRFYVIPSVSVR